jgi:hypothetical protein
MAIRNDPKIQGQPRPKRIRNQEDPTKVRGKEQKPESKTEGVADAKQVKEVLATPEALQTEGANSVVVDRDVRQGLDASVADVSGADAAQTWIDGMKAVRDSHAGAKVAKNELTPEFKAANDLLKAFGPDVAALMGVKLDARLAEKAPGLHAAKQAMEPHVGKMIDDIVQNPQAMSALSGLMASIGKDGLAAALKAGGPDVAHQVAEAMGTALMNPEATVAGLTGFASMIAKVWPQKGEAAAKLATSIGGKLGLAEKMVAGAGGAAKVAQTAEAGAQVAGAGAKATAQSVPGLNVILGAATTTAAGVGLVKSLLHKPRSGLRIGAELGNTLIQAMGVAFPIVGGVGTVLKVGVDKLLDKRDEKAGRAPPQASFDLSQAKASMPALMMSLEAMEEAFKSGEHPEAAARMAGLRQKAQALHAHSDELMKLDGGPKQGESIEQWRASLHGFMESLTSTTSAELGIAAGEQKAGPERDAILAASQGMGKMFATLKRHGALERDKKKAFVDVKPEDELKKRAELRGEIMGVAKEALVAIVGAFVARKDQSGGKTS